MTGQGHDGELPHPRDVADLIGHEAAEAALLDAWNSGRLPHAWLITGPKGTGKATLAYRFARFVLAQGPTGRSGSLFGAGNDLAVAADDPIFRRIASGGHADLLTVERPVDTNGRRKTEITVNEVRRLREFFTLTAAESGYRIAIVDSADELNRNAANALLKILEEPPEKSLILLVAQGPEALLPTVRSRCRRLVLRPLSDDLVMTLLSRHYPALPQNEWKALADLAGGSPGRALGLAEAGGIALYRDLVALLAPLPQLDWAAVHHWADHLARRENDRLYALTLDLLMLWLSRLMRSAATRSDVAESVPGEFALRPLAAEFGLRCWLAAAEDITRDTALADALNLDRKQLLLNAVFSLRRAAEPMTV
jgi:DNA polymerase-3 subunit delta'